MTKKKKTSEFGENVKIFFVEKTLPKIGRRKSFGFFMIYFFFIKFLIFFEVLFVQITNIKICRIFGCFTFFFIFFFNSKEVKEK